jgi:flavorubredoxin
MIPRNLKENIFAVGAIDWDRTLFDALIPLPHGTTYNAYLVRGSQKVALIDTVDPVKTDILKSNLAYLNIDKIDYIISNHAEQDHSGAIPEILSLYPESRLITNKKGQDMLLPLLEIPPERITIIEDRETLSLGDKTLQFILAPWVHWPETMFTYLMEDRLLFSCDLFGSHLASSQLFASQNEITVREAKRYHAEIMMSFSGRIEKHLQSLQDFNIEMIAPSHGPVYDNPSEILSAYQEWVSPVVKNEVVIIYVSMHGSTEKLVLRLLDLLVNKGIKVIPFNMVTADLGELALALVDAAGLIIASPAVLMGLHPNIVSTTYLVNSLKPKTRYVSLMGSFGWANKMVTQVTELLKDLNAEMLEPLLIKGVPKIEFAAEIDRYAELITKKHLSVCKI